METKLPGIMGQPMLTEAIRSPHPASRMSQGPPGDIQSGTIKTAVAKSCPVWFRMRPDIGIDTTEAWNQGRADGGSAGRGGTALSSGTHRGLLVRRGEQSAGVLSLPCPPPQPIFRLGAGADNGQAKKKRAWIYPLTDLTKQPPPRLALRLRRPTLCLLLLLSVVDDICPWSTLDS